MYLQNFTTSDADFYVTNASTTAESPVDPTIIFGAQRDSLKIVIPVTIIYTVIFVTGLVGNILTCIVITRNKSMQTATNYYLFSLAISDLLLLISGMPQEIYSIWYKWPYVFGETFCLFRGLAAETSTNASILTISLFTIERYLAICHPFQSHKMSKLSRATKHVMALWVVAFLFALPQALQFGLRSHKGVVMCLQTRVIVAHSFEVSTFLFFCAPIVLISVLYFLIGLRLKETSKGRVSLDFEQCSALRTVKLPKRHSQSTKRVIKMLVAVVVAFFVCWAPFHAQRLLAIYGTTENHLGRSPNLVIIYGILTYTSGILYYVSTSINPILYHIMCNKFRVAFKVLLFRTRCCGVAMRDVQSNSSLARRWHSLGYPLPAGQMSQVTSLIERRQTFVKRHRSMPTPSRALKAQRKTPNGVPKSRGSLSMVEIGSAVTSSVQSPGRKMRTDSI